MRRFLILAVIAVGTAVGLTAGASVASAALDLTFDGPGTGTVTSSPAGIDCSNVPGSTHTTCSYDFGSSVWTATLTATGGEGSAFVSWSGSGGGTCTGATNPCTTGFLFFGAAPVARFAPKPDVPAVTTGSVSGVGFPSATVAGSVNPGSDDFAIKNCYFEYGLTTEYGDTAACRPGSIAAGTSPVAVDASIGVLQPGRTYHYRLVASNGGGIGQGQDQTFNSAAAPADSCPNAEIREQQGALAQRLPDCGAYELVSPLFTAGQPVDVATGTVDGDRVMLGSVGGFAGTENLPSDGAAVKYATVRTATGWDVSAIAPPASQFPWIGSWSALDWTRDGSRSLWFVNLKADRGTYRFTPVVRDPDGSFHVAGATQGDVGGQPVLPAATSEDLRTVGQRTFTRVALTDHTVDSRVTSVKSLYLSTYGPDRTLSVRQVAYRDGATMFPDCGAEFGGAENSGSNTTSRNAISRDGSRVFFTFLCSDPTARRVWVKTGNAEPVDVSASQCSSECGDEAQARFQGASRDGSRVYFTTAQRLLDEDENTTAGANLYEYDFNATGQKLRLVTGGAGSDGANVERVLRISDDGAYVYFVASGPALAEENARGATPQPGESNLYVHHRLAGQPEGTTIFVGALGSDYGSLPQASSTGRFLLFQTTANLTGEKLDGDTFRDLYRYDAQTDELLRVWTTDSTHNGTEHVDTAYLEELPESADNVPSGGVQRSAERYSSLQLSDDGSKVGFTTSEPLNRDDHNTRTDGYLWHAETGRIDLLTDGTSRPGSQFRASQFQGMTPSGDSLFVFSSSPLLKEHTNGQSAVYVIRRNGGFPAPAAPVAPCEGEACQGSPSPPAGPLGPTGSSLFSGPGNVAPVESKSVAKVWVAKVKPVRGSATRVSVTVSGRGRLLVSGSGLTPSSASAKKAGTYRVPVKLSKRAKRTLQRKHRVKVRASVRFVPSAGESVVARASVTFTAKAKKSSSKASPRSAREAGVLSSVIGKGR